MRLRHVSSIVVLLLSGPFAALPVRAQSHKAAWVEVTADPLPVKQHDQGTVTIHVVALTAIERLEVSLSARTGVAIVNAVPTASFSNLKAGARRYVQAVVRLTAEAFGYILVSAKVTTSTETHLQNRTITVGAMPPPPPRVPVGITEDLADLTLVKVSGAHAIVRFGQKEMLVVRVGDRLGRNTAELVEIAPGRVVLDETFTGTDGRPNRARVTLTEGQKGGTRMLVRPEEEPPATSRQRIVVPGQRPVRH